MTARPEFVVVQFADTVVEGNAVGEVVVALAESLGAMGIRNGIVTFDGSRRFASEFQVWGPNLRRIPFRIRRALYPLLVPRAIGDAVIRIVHDAIIPCADINVVHHSPWRNCGELRNIRDAARLFERWLSRHNFRTRLMRGTTLVPSPLMACELRARCGIEAEVTRLPLRAAARAVSDCALHTASPSPGEPLVFLLAAQGNLRAKGYDAAIRVCSSIRANGCKVSLVVLGDDRDILEHPAWVRLQGRLPHTEALSELARCDAVLVVSEFESLSFVAVEAAMLGKPVVRSGHVGLLSWSNFPCLTLESLEQVCRGLPPAELRRRFRELGIETRTALQSCLGVGDETDALVMNVRARYGKEFNDEH